MIGSQVDSAPIAGLMWPSGMSPSQGPEIYTGAQLFGGGPTSTHPSPHVGRPQMWWVSS